MKFTTEQLQDWFSGKVFHTAYDETVKLAQAMKVHADGLYPGSLICERRPSESLAVKEYREKIWRPITELEFGKVVNCLNKIRRSSDWSIKFEETDANKKITPGETLADYCETGFPFFTSLTNWAFNVLLRAYCIDANAVICIMPVKEDVASNDFVRPFPFLFQSEQVIDFVEGDYAVLKSADKVLYTENDVKKWGNMYYVVTTTVVQRYDQYTSEGHYRIGWEYNHNIGVLPVVKTKGIFKEAQENTFLFKSRLSVMLPRLDEAVREYSDLQAEVVQHIFSEKWEYVTDDCGTCKGKGEVPGAYGRYETCIKCHGTGNKPRGPYTSLQLKAPMAGEAAAPTPPIGYVQKQIEIARLQDERIDKHIYKAFSALNMEFLANTPLNQSGLAKEVDRDELNTFVNAVAEDIVAVLDSVVYFVNEYRYSLLIPNQTARLEMLPNISVPEKFDILTSNYLEKELQNARDNKVNPVIVNAMEIEYANKKFNADPEVRDKVALTLSLDPLAGVAEDDKMVRLSNGGITKESYIISCNVQNFIERAIDEKGDQFYKMDIKDKKLLMREYAREQLEESSAVKTILSEEITA